MKIVCDNKIPFIKGVLEPYAEVVYMPGAQTGPEVVKDADAIITRTRTICNESLLKGSSVKVIATATIGFDHIDTKWCEENGIIWKNAPGCNSWSVKQYIASVLCTLAAKHGFKLSQTTLGVVGIGNVGSKVAKIASILGMRVLKNDPPRQLAEGLKDFVSLDTIMDESDIITIHVPLEKSGDFPTWHLFDKERISRLKKNQILVNSSRGPVVDNPALKEVLKAKAIKGAVLDVWEAEPNLDAELVNLLDISTPHIAGYSADGKANGTTMSIHTIAEALGLPLTEWIASDIPAPEQALCFEINAAGKDLEAVLSEAVLYTYKVQEDSDRLRGQLDAFEKLRGDYQIRREFKAFTVKLSGGTAEEADKLGEMGFKVIF